MIWRKGDKLIIEINGRSELGMVLLASPNGKSLAIGFEAILGGHAGTVPLLRDDDGVYRSLLTNAPVTLKALS